MLNAQDIYFLEKRWFRYRLKRFINLFLLIVFIFIIICLFLYYFVKFDTLKKNTDNIEQNLTITQNTPLLMQINNNIEKKIDNSKNNISNQNIQNNHKITEHNLSKKEDVKLEFKTYFLKEQTGENNLSILQSFPQASTQNQNQNQNQNQIENKAQAENEVQAQTENLGKNLAQTDNVDTKLNEAINKSIEYLKKQYFSTNDIIYAIMLAQEFYSLKDYDNSLKWSIAANTKDNKNEKSWIIFAKSKYRQNKKEDAIVALRTYLKIEQNPEVLKLLDKINLDELAENE